MIPAVVVPAPVGCMPVVKDQWVNTVEYANSIFREPIMAAHLLTRWEPENTAFWESEGKAIARRNLWISIPALLLAFSVWMVWSVVVVNLPNIGFQFSTNQLFWLAAVPGLSGATLRIFYSFMVPILGGRLWTTLSTASLAIPALWMGYAVQDPSTPYPEFLVIALLCGFGGGNFASSMANISFFYPKAQQGTALGLNAGLGNVGNESGFLTVRRRRPAVRKRNRLSQLNRPRLAVGR